MKKILSMLLCAAMLVGCFVMTSTAADTEVNKAVLFDDLAIIPSDDPEAPVMSTGAAYYSYNGEEYVHSYVGYVMLFDFMPLKGVPCEHGGFSDPAYKHMCQFMFTPGDGDGYKIFAYNFERQSLLIGRQYGWMASGYCDDPESDKCSYFVDVEKEIPLEYGEWHRLAFLIDDVYLEMYLDGELILEADYTTVGHNNSLMMSQHCRYLMDNVVFANHNYDIQKDDLEAEIAAGNVYNHCDFDDLTTDDLFVEVPEGEKRDNSKTGDIDFSTSTCYSIVDVDSYAGTLRDSDDANALSLSDVTGKAGKTFEADLTYNGGAFEAKKLSLLNDSLMTFDSVTDVADGCTVTVSNGLVDISVTDAFKGGKVATFNFTMAEVGPFQGDEYRYGLKVTDASTAPENLVLDAGGVTIINFILGDVNEDGKKNIKDIMNMLKYTADWTVEQIGTFNFEAADLYADGKINVRDIQHYVRWLAGKPGYEL